MQIIIYYSKIWYIQRDLYDAYAKFQFIMQSISDKTLLISDSIRHCLSDISSKRPNFSCNLYVAVSYVLDFRYIN